MINSSVYVIVDSYITLRKTYVCHYVLLITVMNVLKITQISVKYVTKDSSWFQQVSVTRALRIVWNVLLLIFVLHVYQERLWDKDNVLSLVVIVLQKFLLVLMVISHVNVKKASKILITNVSNALRIVDIVLKKLIVFSVTLDTIWNMISPD